MVNCTAQVSQRRWVKMKPMGSGQSRGGGREMGFRRGLVCLFLALYPWHAAAALLALSMASPPFPFALAAPYLPLPNSGFPRLWKLLRCCFAHSQDSARLLLLLCCAPASPTSSGCCSALRALLRLTIWPVAVILWSQWCGIWLAVLFDRVSLLIIRSLPPAILHFYLCLSPLHLLFFLFASLPSVCCSCACLCRPRRDVGHNPIPNRGCCPLRFP